MSYKIRYDFNLEIGDFEKEDAGDKGLTDALFFVSCVYSEDGSYSQMPFSRDGRLNGPISNADIFKIWITLAANIAKFDDISEGKRLFAERTFEDFRTALLASQD